MCKVSKGKQSMRNTQLNYKASSSMRHDKADELCQTVEIIKEDSQNQVVFLKAHRKNC